MAKSKIPRCYCAKIANTLQQTHININKISCQIKSYINETSQKRKCQLFSARFYRSCTISHWVLSSLDKLSCNAKIAYNDDACEYFAQIADT